MPYQNYHRHSYYSNIILRDSQVSNEDYCKRAKELGHSLISSCEHGTPGNYRQCAELAEKYGLHWRYVCEAYFVKHRDPDLTDKTNCHMILAAKTAKGIGDINEVISEANLSGYYHRARIDLELLMKLDPKDVFITTACVAGIWSYGFEEAERLVKMIHQRFGSSFMLEVQPHHTEKQKEINRFILSLYRKYGIPMIAGMDSHYIYEEDAALRDDYLASSGFHYEDEDGWFMDYPDDDTAYQRFVQQGVLPENLIREALENTNIFLTFEDVVFDKSRKLPTLYPDKSQDEKNEMYRALIRERWLKRRETIPREKWNEYQQGIAYEVNTITSTNMSDYFLLDYELVKRGLELGGQLTYTGRGSAPSFYTNTLLGFSSIDRFALPVTMYPDRFISADRLKAGSVPDIDNNISDQAPFYQAQKELLGEWTSAPMLAYGTMKRLAAFKMYCRANNVPFEVANEISDALKKYELDVKHADEGESIDVMDYVPAAYAEYIQGSEQYIGVIDHVSPHPCAYVLTSLDIRREFGVIRLKKVGGDPVYCALIDGAQADQYGYLKNDWLVVTVVKLIKDIYDRIGLPQPTVPELLLLVEGDKPTWELYAKGCTLGLNQVEREKSREKTMRYKPGNLTELSALVAALRPAFQSMLDVFLNRQHFDYGIPVLDKLLQTPEMPNSFVLYQEQMMKVLQYGGFTPSESYAAIKAIAKKHPEKVLPLKERFCDFFSRRLIEEENTPADLASETTTKVWQILSDACSYGFAAPHAVAMALDSLYCAWAKAHYPYEYYAALLTNYAERGDKDKITLARAEMKKYFGIEMKLPKFREDNRSYYINKEEHYISDVISSAKGMSARFADDLWELHDRSYGTFVDLLADLTMNTCLTRSAIETLIRIGYFEEFGGNAKLLAVFSEFVGGVNRFSKSHKPETQIKRLAALRDIEHGLPDAQLDAPTTLSFELKTFGAPISVYKDFPYFLAMAVDDTYSPKLVLYNCASGTTGNMKTTKRFYLKNKLKVGDFIRLGPWRRSPAYQYKDGKRIPKPGVTELWLDSYEVMDFQNFAGNAS